MKPALLMLAAFMLAGCGSGASKAEQKHTADLQATVAALQRQIAQAASASAVTTTLAPQPTPQATPIDLKKQLNDVVAVTLISKGSYKGDYRTYITYKFAFQNKTVKDMVGVKGVAIFSDVFGDEIQSIKLTYDQRIPAGQAVIWEGQTDYNEFIQKDRKLMDTPQDRIQFSFDPQAVLFADGTKLDVTGAGR